MRIAINTLTVNRRECGGGEIYLYYLLHSLAENDKKNQYFVLVSSANKDRFTINQGNFTQVLCPIGGLNRPKRILWEQVFLPQMLKKLGIDVFHSPNNISPISVPCKSVVTIHIMINFIMPWEFKPVFRRWYTNVLMRLSAKRADKIVSVSGYLKKEITDFLGLPGKKIAVIHHGVDEKFSPISSCNVDYCKKKYGIKNDYILCVANNYAYKNLGGLICAFGYLKAKYKIPHQLVLVGSLDIWKGRKKRLLTEIQRGGAEVEENVVCTDFVEHNEMPALYSGCSVFVLPSYHESFGIPLLEAIICGAPVVTSTLSAMPEIVGDAGILVNPYNVEEIAEAVYQVLSKPSLREELVKKGVERAKQFSWEDAARKTLAVYEEVYGCNEPQKRDTV